MLHKYPKPAYRRKIKTGAKIFFVIEGIAFFSSFGIWYKLNTERDFRLYIRNSFPSILNGYYNIGEYFDSSNPCRQLDYSVWLNEKKISE